MNNKIINKKEKKITIFVVSWKTMKKKQTCEKICSFCLYSDLPIALVSSPFSLTYVNRIEDECIWTIVNTTMTHIQIEIETHPFYMSEEEIDFSCTIFSGLKFIDIHFFCKHINCSKRYAHINVHVPNSIWKRSRKKIEKNGTWTVMEPEQMKYMGKESNQTKRNINKWHIKISK